MKDRPGRITGAVAGVVAAGVALGVSELASGVNRRVPPLVAAVADLVIDRAPRAIVESGIAGFGTRTKGVLLVVIVTVSLLVGAALGAVSARPGRRWPVVVGFAGFGLVGVVAGARDPQAWAALGLASAVLAVEAGIGTFVGLLRVLPTAAGTESPDPRAHGLTARLRGRRAFLGLVGAAAMTAAGTAWLGRVLRGRGSVDAARAAVLLPRPDQSAPPTGASALEVPGLTSLVTPNDRFYRVDIAVLTPQVHPDDWRLRVTGMVDRPYELSFDELLRMPMVEEYVTLACVSNEVGGPLVGNARWLGVPLRELVRRARVQRGATQIVGRSVDGFTTGFPTSVALDGRSALVAVGMNAEPLPILHGFPARLVVAGLYGSVSATKWLDELELTTFDAFDAYWARRGWAARAPVETQARIDVPRDGRSLTAGTVVVAGVAWAPARGIAAVEVRVDDDPWVEAELASALSDDSWRQWRLRWDAPPGPHTLRARATDGDGRVQTGEAGGIFPDGATGHHTVRVTVRAR